MHYLLKGFAVCGEETN